MIRAVTDLESLSGKYFATADVCGILKVWDSYNFNKELIQISLNTAVSYNSLIEVKDLLPKSSDYKNASVLAVALKS